MRSRSDSNVDKAQHNSCHKKIYNVSLLSEAAILSEPTHFGELALIKSGKRRTATVITKEDTHFAIMDK